MRGNVDPLTPIPGLAGGIGRTPVPVVESTCWSGEEAFTPREIPGRKGLEQRSTPRESTQDQGELARRAQDTPVGKGPDWVLPEPSEPHRPPGGGDVQREVPFQGKEEWGGNSLRQGSPPEHRIVETDKRCQKRLAALARDHIIKLREEREHMAYGWLGEYAEWGFSAKQGGISLGPLKAEYIHQYNRMLDWEKQPHSDFFTNLSPEVEEELDFSEEDPFDLSVYDQSFEWDEVEYMRLRFIATRHYVSQGHWDDAYAYILRTRPDNIPQHEDVYNRNAQAWHYTNAKINELIQGAEQALETRDRELAHGPQFVPPKDSLIPLGHPTESPSPTRDDRDEEQGLGRSEIVTPTRSSGRPEGRTIPKSPLSPDKKTQKEERDSVVDTVKQITGARKETPVQEGVSVYDWDTRYDGISGFPS